MSSWLTSAAECLFQSNPLNIPLLYENNDKVFIMICIHGTWYKMKQKDQIDWIHKHYEEK